MNGERDVEPAEVASDVALDARLNAEPDEESDAWLNAEPNMDTKVLSIVLATSNSGKIREFARLFKAVAPEVECNLVSLRDAGLSVADEVGDIFLDNARIKAVAASSEVDALCLGEDSGLEVDHLGGAPGARSHRFSFTGSDEDNNLLLLREMEGVPSGRRSARYISAIVVAKDGQVVAEGEGVVEGAISTEMLGEKGFGYDPLFYSCELRKTFGQASDLEKDSVSHRRRALERVARVLCRLCRGNGSRQGESG